MDADTNYFSPNFDGIQDTINLTLKINDNSIITAWEADVMDNNNNIIKKFKSVDKLSIKSLTFQKFLDQIFSLKHQVDIPSKLIWNGEDDSGKVVPDGSYKYILKAWDDNKNDGKSMPGDLNVITVTPFVAASPSYLTFSPDNGGDRTNIAFNIKSSNIISLADVKAEIIDNNSNIVNTFDYQGSTPQTLTWDGRDSKGSIAPEGIYSFVIRASDPAGNSAQTEINSISLITAVPSVYISRNVDVFSPALNSIALFIQSISNPSPIDRMNKWHIRIYDTNNYNVKEFSGTGLLPPELVWDGKDNNNIRLPDSIYSYNVQLDYESGLHPKSDTGYIEIRSTPTSIRIIPQYISFSPIEGSRQKTISFTNILKGKPSDSIELKIFDSISNIVYYDREDLSNFPAVFTWNGLDNNLSPLPEGRYSYVIDASDNAGNKNESRVDSIFLKTGREKITAQSDVGAISPVNSTQNKAVFTITGSKDDVAGYTFEIKTSNNNIVWNTNANTFIDNIIWNGIDNSGNHVTDGIYTYDVKVTYNNGQAPEIVSEKYQG